MFSSNTNDFIKKAKQIHNNKYDYSKVDYKNCKTKVIIICKIHGDFLQIPNSHLRGRNCPKCVQPSYKYTLKDFLEKINIVHGKKYDYSKTKYNKSSDKIEIICHNHGSFFQIANNHLRGARCPKCAGCHRYTTEEWIYEARKIHECKYDYSKVKYIDAITEVKIICKTHGLFLKKPSMHLQGSGCPKCQMCPKCLLWMTGGKLCQYCKPKNQNKLYQKTKEMYIVKYLREKLPDENFIHNKSVGTECTGGHFFPDIRFDCIWFQLIIEVDEHKHRGTDYKCDEKRMYDITAKLGQPCIFIRYNPDSKKSNKEKLLERIQYYLDLQNIYLDEDLDVELDDDLNGKVNEEENEEVDGEIDEDDDLNEEVHENLDENCYEKLGINNLLGFKAEYLFY